MRLPISLLRPVNWFRRRDPWDQATAILLVATAVTILLTFRNYGVSWDEEFCYTHGKYFLNWYTSGFRDRLIISTFNNDYLYGGFFNAVATFIADRSLFGRYETLHLVSAAAGLLGIGYAYRLGKLLGGPMAGFLSALILTLTPAYYGHSFMNQRDLPFAVFFIVALYYITRAYDELPRLSTRSVVVTGVAIGLALGIRVGGLILAGYFVVLIGLWHLVQFRKRASQRSGVSRRDLGGTAVTLVLVGLVAWVVMLIWWPYAQLNPVLNPLRALAESSNFTKWYWTVLYRGVFIPSDSLPWHYLPVSFLVTLPEYYVVALGGGLVALGVSLVRRLRREPGHEANTRADHETNIDVRTKVLFLVFAAFFPLAVAIAMRPVLYDVHRHFLFVIPPLAVLSGVALGRLLSEGLPRLARMVLAALVVLTGALTIADMVRLHPYEYAFYNRSSGGLRSAYGRYETEYWGVSYKEGVDWLIAHYRPDAPPASIRVANTSNPFLTSYYLRPDRPETQRFVQVGLGDNPDVILSITRWYQHLNYPGRLLHVVERMGTPLLYVIETSRRSY